MLKRKLLNDFTLFNIFAGLFICLAISEIWIRALAESWIFVPLVLSMTAIAFVLIFKKRTDEFSAECWKVATTTAFALVLVSPFMVGFLQGLTRDSITALNEANHADTLWTTQILLFIVAFYAKRLRG